jgi:hypothetical protein
VGAKGAFFMKKNSMLNHINWPIANKMIPNWDIIKIKDSKFNFEIPYYHGISNIIYIYIYIVEVLDLFLKFS